MHILVCTKIMSVLSESELKTYDTGPLMSVLHADSIHVCGLFCHNLYASHIELLMLSLGCSRVLSNVWLRVTHRDYCLYDTV